MGVSFPAWRQPSKGKNRTGLEAGDCDKRFSALQAKVFSLLVFSDSWKSPTELKHRDLKARKCLVFLNVSRAKRLSHCEQLTKRFYRAVETLQSRQIVGISLKIKKKHLRRLFIKQMRNGEENLSLREYSCSQPKSRLWHFEEALRQGTRSFTEQSKDGFLQFLF